MKAVNYSSPFQLDPSTGTLRLRDSVSGVCPGMTLASFQSSEFFPHAKQVGKSERPGDLVRFTFKTKWTDQWAFMGFLFKDSFKGLRLSTVGFGWGALRNGFEEIDKTEFQTQLAHFKEWLEMLFGPSQLPRHKREAYFQKLAWGEVSADSDSRTELVGISLKFENDAI
jgi:hypothetical protein